MADDDVYEIDSVPRFAVFGDGGLLANETVGDKFFDFMTPVENKENNHLGKLGTPDFQKLPTISSPKASAVDKQKKEPVRDADDDDPLGMRKLAMFRPPRRSRAMAQTAQQRLQKQSTSKLVETGNNATGSSSRSRSIETRRSQVVIGTERTARIAAVGVRQRSASVDTLRVKEKPKIIQGMAKSAGVRKSPVVVRRNSSGNIPSQDAAARVRHRSESVNAPRCGNPVRVPVGHDSLATSSKSRRSEVVRRSLSQQRNLAAFTNTSSVPNTAKTSQNTIQPKDVNEKIIRRSILQTSSRSRPITRAYALKTEAVKLKREGADVAATGVQVAGSKKDVKKASLGRVGSVGSEAQFRDAVRKRASGGASLERPVKTEKTALKKEIPTIFSADSKSTPQIRKVLRSSKVREETGSPLKQRSPKNVGTGRPWKTAAERDAFFRRLSTPKHISAVDKSNGETPRKSGAGPRIATKGSRIIRSRSVAANTGAVRVYAVVEKDRQ